MRVIFNITQVPLSLSSMDDDGGLTVAMTIQNYMASMILMTMNGT